MPRIDDYNDDVELTGTEKILLSDNGTVKNTTLTKLKNFFELLSSGGITSTIWGGITGSINDQTDLKNALDSKQDTLVSGTNIKTINGESVLGSGDIGITGGGTVDLTNYYDKTQADTLLSNKVDKGEEVVGATKTKITYNNDGLVTGGTDLVEADLPNISQTKITDLISDLSNKQDTLISGTSIKTINGQSVLGNGDIVITSGGTVDLTPHSVTKTTIGLEKVENIAPEDMPVSKPAEDEFLSHSLLMGIQTLSNYEEMEILKRFIVSNLHSRVGELVMTTSNAPFSDCIFADGVLLKRSEYPLLWRFAENSGNIVSDSKWKATHKFAYSYGDGVSTFRIPDYRGEFIRGFDAGAGVDTNRTLGSLQMDDFKSHKHPELPLSWRAIFTAGADRYGWYWDENGYAKPPQYEAGGSETRPRNGTVVYCIKYK